MTEYRFVCLISFLYVVVFPVRSYPYVYISNKTHYDFNKQTNTIQIILFFVNNALQCEWYCVETIKTPEKETEKKIIFHNFVHFIMYLCLLRWNKQNEKQRPFSKLLNYIKIHT